MSTQVGLVSLAGLAGLALAVSACSGSDGSPPRSEPTPVLTTSAAPKPTPPPPPPEHACYRLEYDGALAPTNSSRAVPCTGRHTAVTFYVGRFDRNLPVGGTRVHRIVSTVCPRRFASFVGGTLEYRRLSLLRTVWFTPTTDQAALGAHWYTCVAIAVQSEQRLAPLTVPVTGALNHPERRDHYALCGTAEPGTPAFRERMCSLRHSWKALRTVPFAPGRYPGEGRVRAAGQRPCQEAGRQVATDPLNYRWSYQWPTREQWNAGKTWGVCWAPV
ncbi:MAG: hypothetical protein J2P22_13760 [Nocardioides sp.]|nr:hypothetical protein [Nocardioides sp.]